jgi:hypothetical protein
MPDHSADRSSKPENNWLDLYRENPEYLQSPVHRVFQNWYEEETLPIPEQVGRLMLRPWCGSKFPWTTAFDLSLTPPDLEFLRQIGIRP